MKLKYLAAVILLMLSSCSARSDEKIIEEKIEIENNPPIVTEEQKTPEEIELPEETEIEISKEEKYELKICSYLPVSSFKEEMLTNGTFELLDEITLNTGCYWLASGELEIKPNLIETINKIQEKFPELRIYCTINPKKNAASAIYSENQRKILIENMIKFKDENNLYGIDIDWEFPTENEWEYFSNFIAEAAEEGLNFSLAFYPSDVKLSEKAIKSAEKINIMAYDLFDDEGKHSTYEAAENAVKYFIELGFEKKQLSLGIPAYGRPLNAAASWPFYSDFAEELVNGENLIGENYFNSPQLASDKTVFAAEEKLDSVFLYHIGCDLAGNDEKSLLNSISKSLEYSK